MRTIGILGGMGPEATVLLMQRIIAATSAHDDADHVPLLVDQNPQVPSRIAALIEGTGADPAPVLIAMARRLEEAGAEALAMPCNTAHHYAPVLAESVHIPFLNMVELAAAQADNAAAAGDLIGVLASPAVRITGILDRALAQRERKAIYPDDEAALLRAIRSIKARGANETAREALLAASVELRDRGAQVQLVACTEFSLLGIDLAPRAQVLDTLDLLVGAICDFARSSG
nr:amino acid racemase [Citreimonas salinaria]